MHARPHWSYSAISQYLSCPLRFYFQRVLLLPQQSVSSSLVLGAAVHAAMAEYHRNLQQNQPIDTANLQQIVVDTWTRRHNETRITFRSGETQDGLLTQAISLVDLYLQDPPPENILAVEKEIIAPLHNSQGEYLETPLIAVADLIVQGTEGLVVREFKTSGRSYSEMEAETSLQPTCYVKAVQETYGHSPTVEFVVLVKTKVPKVQRITTVRTAEDLARLGDLVEIIERAIQAQVFYPVETPLNCVNCPYRQPCREWGQPKNPERIPLHLQSAEVRAC